MEGPSCRGFLRLPFGSGPESSCTVRLLAGILKRNLPAGALRCSSQSINQSTRLDEAGILGDADSVICFDRLAWALDSVCDLESGTSDCKLDLNCAQVCVRGPALSAGFNGPGSGPGSRSSSAGLVGWMLAWLPDDRNNCSVSSKKPAIEHLCSYFLVKSHSYHLMYSKYRIAPSIGHGTPQSFSPCSQPVFRLVPPWSLSLTMTKISIERSTQHQRTPTRNFDHGGVDPLSWFVPDFVGDICQQACFHHGNAFVVYFQ